MEKTAFPAKAGYLRASLALLLAFIIAGCSQGVAQGSDSPEASTGASTVEAGDAPEGNADLEEAPVEEESEPIETDPEMAAYQAFLFDILESCDKSFDGHPAIYHPGDVTNIFETYYLFAIGSFEDLGETYLLVYEVDKGERDLVYPGAILLYGYDYASGSVVELSRCYPQEHLSDLRFFLEPASLGDEGNVLVELALDGFYDPEAHNWLTERPIEPGYDGFFLSVKSYKGEDYYLATYGESATMTKSPIETIRGNGYQSIDSELGRALCERDSLIPGHTAVYDFSEESIASIA